MSRPIQPESCFNPKISIITISYNAADDLEKTINSVINQSYLNIEYILIDGNSHDHTHDVLQRYRDKIHEIVSEPDNGIYDAMNKGISLAQGDYLQFLNAGDYFCDSNSLSSMVSAANHTYDIIYGDIMLVNVGGGQRHHKALEFTLANLKSNGTGVLCHQAMLARRELASCYSPKYRYKGELNWYFDFFVNKKDISFFHYEEPVVYYFLGGTGYTNFIKNRLEWYSILIKRFGLRSVFNKNFLRFIYKDFRNRYINSKKF